MTFLSGIYLFWIGFTEGTSASGLGYSINLYFLNGQTYAKLMGVGPYSSLASHHTCVWIIVKVDISHSDTVLHHILTITFFSLYKQLGIFLDKYSLPDC